MPKTYKKRLNPKTGKPFERGDVLEDGKVFHAYSTTIKRSSGFCAERWFAPENVTNNQESKRFSKRLSPHDGQEFRIGDRDTSGRYFICYRSFTYNGIHNHEEWASPKRWHKIHVQQTLISVNRTAVKKNLPFDLDIDFLLMIFPINKCCPALSVEMEWSTKCSSSTSPSLDRIIPEHGYVKGNVAWISLKANIIKNDASFKEIRAVGLWLKTIECIAV